MMEREIICSECKTLFKSKRYNKIFCNRRCYLKNYNKSDLAKKRKYEYSKSDKFKQKLLIRKQKEGYKERRRIVCRRYALKNKLKIKEYNRNHKKSYRTIINRRIRQSFRQSFKRYVNKGKVFNSKKYGIDFTSIIEKLKPFPKDIYNYHIDHIIPLSKFNLNKIENIKIAFHKDNIQWLRKEDNLLKSNKIIPNPEILSFIFNEVKP